MPDLVLIIGADAAGMAAAHQALRSARAHGREIEVLALERTQHTSYSACGLPYWIGGEVDSGEALVARSAAKHRELGVDLRLGAEVTHLDTSAKVATWRDSAGEHRTHYDEVVIATGGTAVVPDWAAELAGVEGTGVGGSGVGVVKTLDDGAAWLDRFSAAPAGARVVIAGGRYIGVEMAEAALARGFAVTLATRSRVMSDLDPALSDLIVAGLRAAGVEVLEGAETSGLRSTDGHVTAVVVGEREVPCDLLVLALGVRPALDFTDLPRGPHGGLRPDETGRIAAGVWAAGDCCEVTNLISGAPAYLPLGTHANKLGRVVGDRIGGGSLSFPGALGTAITRFAHGSVTIEIARTGLSTKEALAAGFDAETLITEGNSISGYLPHAPAIAVAITAEKGTRRLLGAQIVGGIGTGKRIDTVAAALWGRASVDDLAWMDLAYAPPFATAWDIVSVAARRLAERLP